MEYRFYTTTKTVVNVQNEEASSHSPHIGFGIQQQGSVCRELQWKYKSLSLWFGKHGCQKTSYVDLHKYKQQFKKQISLKKGLAQITIITQLGKAISSQCWCIHYYANRFLIIATGWWACWGCQIFMSILYHTFRGSCFSSNMIKFTCEVFFLTLVIP